MATSAPWKSWRWSLLKLPTKMPSTSSVPTPACASAGPTTSAISSIVRRLAELRVRPADDLRISHVTFLMQADRPKSFASLASTTRGSVCSSAAPPTCRLHSAVDRRHRQSPTRPSGYRSGPDAPGARHHPPGVQRVAGLERAGDVLPD